MIFLATILSGLSLLMGILFFTKLKSPFGWAILFIKLGAGAFSSFWAVMGLAGAILGWVYSALWAVPMGSLGAGMMIWYIWISSRDHKGFESAFGADWSDQIPAEQVQKMAKRRWSPFLTMKASPEPTFERDITFWKVPGTDRNLLCDLWSPANGDVSGLCFIYFHGSAWYLLDKDFGTRPFFHHLVAQGHTVMDVAYRLCPEVDIYGMIGDVKHAVAWMKANADQYGVNPEKIVLGGASAGAHLALLAAYAPQHPELTPEDLKDTDLSVGGVVSYYGPTDLLIAYEHLNLQGTVNLPPVPVGKKPEQALNMQDVGRLDILLGGHPQDAHDTYQLASPVSHVQPGNPPTLLIQGNHDMVVSLDATCSMYTKLVDSDVPAINVVLPGTDHAFDLVLPQVNPAAQSALYDVDRFLAILANRG